MLELSWQLGTTEGDGTWLRVGYTGRVSLKVCPQGLQDPSLFLLVFFLASGHGVSTFALPRTDTTMCCLPETQSNWATCTGIVI